MKRYEWEDALIDAQTAGLIPNGALLLALKLSKAINWAPRKGRKPGLYWKNSDALEAVGAGRSTYFKHKDALFEQGFFTMEKQNLIPALPEESTVETIEDAKSPQYGLEESTVETIESTVWTEESTGEHPFSVDTFSEDVCTVDVFNTPAAAASAEDKDDTPFIDEDSLINEDVGDSLISEGTEGAAIVSEEGGAESTPWTIEEPDYEQLARDAGVWVGYKSWLQVPVIGTDRKTSPRSAYKKAMKDAGKEVKV